MKYSKRLEEEMKLSGGYCCYLLMEIIKKKEVPSVFDEERKILTGFELLSIKRMEMLSCSSLLCASCLI